MSPAKPFVLPIAVAFLIGIVVSLTRRFAVLVVELPVSTPPTELLSWYGFGMRGVAFILVYGTLFGLAYWIDSRTDHPNGDAVVALGSGIAGLLGFCLATTATIVLTDIGYPGITYAVVATVGSGIGTGVELAVVTFAGAALARRSGPNGSGRDTTDDVD